MKKYIIVSLVIAALGFGACRNDNEADLYPIANCDTANTRFATFLEPMLVDQCYECHSTATYTSLGGSRLLEGYVNVLDFINDGSLLSSIKHDGTVSAMPQGKPKLDPCTILRVETWINKGAQDN